MEKMMPMYSESGRVEDPRIAEEMATVEDPIRSKKFLGMKLPWAEKSAGKASEAHIQEGKEIKESELPEQVHADFTYTADQYRNAGDAGFFDLKGYRLVDYGNGKLLYIMEGKITRHGVQGQYVGADRIRFACRTENGKRVHRFAGEE